MVRVKRTINANEWSTICLPFAITAEQVKGVFGDDVQLGDFTGAVYELEGVFSGSGKSREIVKIELKKGLKKAFFAQNR